MTILSVSPASVDTAALATLDEASQKLEAGAVKDALEAFAHALRSGRQVSVVSTDVFVTPSEAATILGVSRTHLYKVLDLGALPFETVGNRDRRIALRDLEEYVAAAEALRQRAAVRRAHAQTMKARALDEM